MKQRERKKEINREREREREGGSECVQCSEEKLKNV